MARDRRATARFALSLVPFAGLFFLWFIAVARDRLGRFEDQFFSTVFLGSGLLFLAMVFAAAASAGAIAASYAKAPSGFAASGTYLYARHMIAQVFNVCALRMAAVFLISQATLWLRTGVMPRWMALADLSRRARPALRRDAVVLGHHGLPGVGLLRQRVHPRHASDGEAGRLQVTTCPRRGTMPNGESDGRCTPQLRGFLATWPDSPGTSHSSVVVASHNLQGASGCCTERLAGPERTSRSSGSAACGSP